LNPRPKARRRGNLHACPLLGFRARRVETAKYRQALASENLAATRRGAAWPPGVVCSCRPLQSLANQQAATAHTAPLPWSSPEAGLGALPEIALRCLLHVALRSGSFGLPRLLPGLTADSACAGRQRTFEVFRIASLITRHCCQRTIDPLFGSPPEHPSCCPDRLKRRQAGLRKDELIQHYSVLLPRERR
jgi:hypothetical protein